MASPDPLDLNVRPRGGGRSLVALFAFVILAGGAFGGWDVWTEYQRSAQRRALDARAAALTERALVPGSPLACLDGAAGEAVETACEKLVFARPETVAAAVAYVGARLSLLRDGLRHAGQGDPAYAEKLSGLRRALELDRYGIVAHILSTRDQCSIDDCPSFVFMRDTGALKANLKARAFDNYVARYAATWTAEEKTPVASQPPAEPAPAPVASAPAPPPAPAPVSSKYDFPSAASIPPVSIMNAEPPLPKEAAPAAAGQSPAENAEGSAALPIPPKRPQGQAAVPPAR